ncbi:MAG: glycosyltransferase family 39 protein [Magnetococcales bacterium]|nr:glycosyltransferase family 39 protein [Magnetococcales bacterium]
MNHAIFDNNNIKWTKFLLVLIIIIGAIPRFYNINNIGVSGSDTFLYWHFASYWSEGNYTFQLDEYSASFYRPLAYFAYGLVAKLLPNQDYAIKLFNGITDLFNIFLIYLIGKHASHTRVGLYASLLYACSPPMISYSRTELLHTFSITFTLISVFLFIKFLICTNNKKNLLLVATGFTLSMAAHIHTSTAFIIFGFGLLLLLNISQNGLGQYQQGQTILKNIGILGASFALPILFVLPLFIDQLPEISQNIKYMLNERSETITSLDSIVSRFHIPPSLYKTIKSSLIFPVQTVYGLYWINIIMILLNMFYRRTAGLAVFSPIIIATGFVLSLMLILPKETDQRTLTPLIPLLILQFCITTYTILSTFNLKATANAALALMTIYYVAQSLPIIIKNSVNVPVSTYKTLYNELKNSLVGSGTILFQDNPANNVRPESIRPYFWKQAVYYHDCREPLDAFVQRHQVRWIMIPAEPIHYTTNSLIIPPPKWAESCFEHKRDHQKMQQAGIVDSGWWIHRIFTEDWLNDMIMNQKGTIIYESRNGKVIQLK